MVLSIDNENYYIFNMQVICTFNKFFAIKTSKIKKEINKIDIHRREKNIVTIVRYCFIFLSILFPNCSKLNTI